MLYPYNDINLCYTGLSVWPIKLNVPPQDGQCHIEPFMGIASETKFHVICTKEFVDDDLPMTYKLMYIPAGGSTQILHSGLYYGPL